MIDEILDLIAAKIADNLRARLNGETRIPVVALPTSSKPRNGRRRVRPSGAKGKPLDMHCRVPGCKTKSKGPRYGFMCEEHLKLPKREQEKARAAYRETRA